MLFRSPGRRPWARVAAVAAVVGLIAGGAAVVSQRGDGPGLKVELDGPRPDLEPAPLSLAGPRDGLDSIQLPLTVTPSTGLRDGDSVSVRAEGFEPGEQVGLVQCAREAGGEVRDQRVGVDGCYIGDYKNITVDADGVAEGTYQVHRLLTTPHTGTVDCAVEAERCMVAMGALSDYDRSGGHPIVFAEGLAPLDTPTMEVTPSEGLADGDEVTVVATGLEPGELLLVEVCSVDPSACWQTGEVVDVPEAHPGAYGYTDESGDGDLGRTIGLVAGNDGRLEATFPVWRFLPGPEAGTYVDCAVSRCTLRVRGTTAPPTVRLRFADGSETPPAPTLQVEPATGLAEGDTVLVRGAGFRAGASLGVMACAVPPTDLVRVGYSGPNQVGYYGCTQLSGGPTSADEEGRFAVEVELRGLGSLVPEDPACGADLTCRPDLSGGDGSGCREAGSCVIAAVPYGLGGSEELGVVMPWFEPAPAPISLR